MHNRIGFWVFVLVVAVGGGWVANQQWGWPSWQLLAPGEQDSGAEDSRTVAQPATGPQDVPVAAVEPAAGPQETPVAAAEPAAAPVEPEAGPQETPVAAVEPAAAPVEPAASPQETSVAAVEPAAAPEPEVERAQGTPAAETPAAAASATAVPPSPAPGPSAVAADSEPSPARDAPAAAAVAESGAPTAERPAAEQPADSPAAQVAAPAADSAPETVVVAAPEIPPAGASEAPDAVAESAPVADDAAVAPPSADQPAQQALIDAPAGAEAASPPPDAAPESAAAGPAGSDDVMPATVEPQAVAEASDAPAVMAESNPAIPATGVGEGPSQLAREAAGSAEQAPEQKVAALLADAKDVVRPSFDVVRVEPDGRAVIAGRAAPGAEVELRSGAQVIDRVHASGRGDWVAIPGKPLSPGEQQLTLVAAHKGAPAIESDQMVVVAVPEPALPATGKTSAGVVKPMAMMLPRDGRGTGRILQAPGRLSAEGTLALMTVGYDHKGQMRLSGEAPPGAPVRVYVDNQPVALVMGDAKGTWSSELTEAMAPGTYTLRLDQLDAKGNTVARIETPITRVSEPPIEGELQVDYVVVQPGNSLWRIARRLSGKGLDYVYIYDSNQAQIRDPNLIFPGQVFEIPPELGRAS